jgi:tetratricopeptide (TPR) repeat protein
VAAGLALAGSQCWAWYHLREARSALERYHNPQAVRHLKICLRIWPNDPDVLLLGARAARRARVYGDAERCLEKYEQVRGLDEAGSFEQLLLTAERDVDSVADLCRKYVEQEHPEAALVLEAVTRGYLQQYRLPEARGCLNRWLQLQPENPQALCLRGQLQLDYEHAQPEAVESYRRAVQLDPEHEEARVGLATALLQTKKYAEAVEHLEYLRRCQPDNLRVQVGLAECRRSLGDAGAALRQVEPVLAQHPQYAQALALRGQLALDADQSEEAESWLRQSLAQDPRDYQANYNLILCLYRNGKGDEALRREEVLKRRDEDLKRFSEVVTHDMAQRPHDPALHTTLGQLLLRSGYEEEGVRWLQSALRQDPDYAPARQALKEHYQKETAKPHGSQ